MCTFGPYAAMFVNRIPRSSKTSFMSPGKPWNLVFASPGKSWKTVFYCLYEPWWIKKNHFSGPWSFSALPTVLCRKDTYASCSKPGSVYVQKYLDRLVEFLGSRFACVWSTDGLYDPQGTIMISIQKKDVVHIIGELRDSSMRTTVM